MGLVVGKLSTLTGADHAEDLVRFPVSIAKGFSEFDPDKDTHFSEVFERADSEMYKNKRIMKVSNN